MANETKHTPGPWRISWDGNDHLPRFLLHSTDEMGSDTMDANARLMTAAPELLEALKGVQHHNKASGPANKLPRSLIAHVNRAVERALIKAKRTPETPKERLEYLRLELRAERISQDGLLELQGLAEHIEPGDVELLEAAGVPEFGTVNPSA